MTLETIWSRVAEDLLGRLDGPLHFRFFVQPLMAIIIAVIDGLKDAQRGNPAYFWAVLTNPEHRMARLINGWKSVGKIFVIAVVLDIAYQLTVYHFIYPGETLIVAVFLAIVPYVLFRGPVNRLVRLRKR